VSDLKALSKSLSVDWDYMERQMEEALDKCLTRDAIDDIIVKYAQRCIEDVIADEIRIFYQVGDGRKHVAEAVMKRLNLHGGES
jgi:hypothetical protein